MMSSVQFYEKLHNLQESQCKSENERLKLERELNSYIKSDHRLSKIKAVRLQTYWKKICEDERKSQWRNEQLLQDMERLESHVTALAQRTEKLQLMKKQYEDYIERTYPNWRDTVNPSHQQQEGQSPNQAVSVDMKWSQQAHPAFPSFSASKPEYGNFNMYPSDPHPTGNMPMLSKQPGIVSDSGLGTRAVGPSEQRIHFNNRPSPVMANSSLQKQDWPMQAGDFQDQRSLYGSGLVDPRDRHDVIGGSVDNRLVKKPVEVAATGHLLPPSGASTLHTISSLPTGQSVNSLQGIRDNYYEQLLATGTQSSDILRDSTARDHDAISNLHQDLYRPKVKREEGPLPNSSDHKQESITVINTTNQPETALQQLGSDQDRVTRVRLHEDPEKKSAVAIASSAGSHPHPSYDNGGADVGQAETGKKDDVNKSHDEPYTFRSTPRSPPMKTPSRQDKLPKTDLDNTDLGDMSELYSEDGLPLIDQKSPQKMKPTGDGLSSVLQGKEPDRSLYLQPDVTLDGLYQLLSAVEAELPAAHNLRSFYRSEKPAESVKNEIIENVNKGATLSHVDSKSVSMVILEQLPLVVMTCEGRCLLPDTVLIQPPPEITEESVRNYIHITCQSFWVNMFDHFVKLLKFRSMTPQQICGTFAHLLIKVESDFEVKAKELLTKMLENVSPEETLLSPSSTSTFSTLPPSPERKPITLTRKSDNVEKILEGQQFGSGLNTRGEDNSLLSLDDDFFSKPLPKPDAVTPLTQSDAYRQLLGETFSTQKSLTYQESDNDDFDELLMSPKAATDTKKKEPDIAEGVDSPGREEKVIEKPRQFPPVSPGRKASMESPPPEPPAVLAVSAEDKGGKSPRSLASTPRKSTRTPVHLRGDSDTDEDIDLTHTATSSNLKSTQPNDDDDFDGFFD